MSTSRPRQLLRAVVAAAGLSAVVSGLVPGAPGRPAAASVDHRLGFSATVAGWTSWYGSYGMGALGPAWCIDHGIPAPDPAYDYRPTGVTDHADATRRAMAWALGRWGLAPDRVTAAALTLVLHDLAGAHYPRGVLDVDTMSAGQMSGFGGLEATVLVRARQIKADAIGHAQLIAPLRVEAHRDPGGPAVVVRVTDAAGTPVPGAEIGLGDPAGPQTTTGGDGRARLAVASPGSAVVVHAAVPDLALRAFAPVRAVAQRVATPATTNLGMVIASPVSVSPPGAPTTTTAPRAAAPTTTAPPRTPSPVVAPTTTTSPPTTAPPTTAPPTTTARVVAAAVAPPAVPPSAAPAVPVVGPPAAAPLAPSATLPYTGASTRRTVQLAIGLVLLGLAALMGSRPPGGSTSATSGVRRLRPT